MNTDNGEVPIEKMLGPAGIAEVLNISRRHLDDLRCEDLPFPRPFMLGRLPRWSPAVMRQWTEGSAALAATEDEAHLTAAPAVAQRGKGPPRVY